MARSRNGAHDRLSAYRSAGRYLLFLQLLGTVATIAWVPGSLIKVVVLLPIWLLGFGRISGIELRVMAAVNLLFILMNLGALRHGIFRFQHPDLWGLPAYEYLTWGFYVLHTIRFVGGRSALGASYLAVMLAAVFALPFSLISEPSMLLLASAAVLAVSLLIFHDPLDLAYAGYMVVVGALIEYAGVWHDEWSYPDNPMGGVPLWFVPMWGGIGLFTRRLIVPILCRSQPAANATD